MLSRINWRVLSLALVVLLTMLTSARAEAPYPQKPINLIVPIPAGGVVDIMARAFAQELKPLLPQPVAVVNKVGAAGTVGTAEVVSSKPDGYTIGYVTRIMLTLQPQRTELPYKGPGDVRPVINLASMPYAIAVKADAPWKTFPEMLAYAKTNPEKLRFGMSGLGTVEDIDVRIMQEKAGVTFTVVQVTSDAEATAQILGGHIDTKLIGGSVAPMVQAGKMRVLAVVGDERSKLFPDAPTFKELGFDFALLPHFCIIAPKGTPDNVIATLHDAFKKTLENDAVKRTAEQNMITLEYLGTKDLEAALEKENVLFRDVIKKYGLK